MPETAREDTPAQPCPTGLRAGARVDARFEVVRATARGGWGEVYEALDHGVGGPEPERVALKLLRPLTEAQERRVHREIRALAEQPARGMVRLIHAGRHEGQLYLVMEWIEGAPLAPMPWDQLQPVVASLLRTLAQLHDRGVVHRDLKPANVMLRPGGEPVLIDFGLATGPSLGAPLTQVGEALGTDQYAPPEQLMGQAVDGRADMYALGVTLYELLTGRLPHRADRRDDLVTERARYRPTPVEQLVALPPAAALLIDRLLQPAPERRPSARDALRLLGASEPPEERALPWLGGEARLQALMDLARSGRLVRVGGGRGSGRTRALREVERRVEGALWLPAGDRPFASLRPLLGALDGAPDLEAVTVAARQALAAAPLLLADPWEGLDPWSRALMAERSPGSGLLASAEGEAERTLPPLREEDLRALFSGPDLLLHLREDATAELARRSGGRPSTVNAVLQRWRREGLARPEGDRFRLTRGALDRLRAEDPIRDDLPADDLPPYLEELLGLLTFCWPHTQLPVLEALSGSARWELVAGLRRLEEGGQVAVEGDRFRPLASADLPWTASRREAARAALARALPLASPRRLGLLLTREEAQPEAVLDEALAWGARMEREGRLGDAIGAIQAAWPILPDPGPLLVPLVRCLLARGRAEDREQARFYATRQGDAALESLIDAIARAETGGLDGLRALRALPARSDPGLELRRLAWTVQAAQKLPLDDQEALLHELSASPAIRGSEAHRAQWSAWMGLLRYQQRRFAEAATLHAEAAAAPSRPATARLVSLINAGRSWIEAGELDAAERLGAEAVALAVDQRDPSQEVQARWLVRAVANRRGETRPDLPLVEALLDPQLQVPAVYRGTSLITEAFIAARGRHAEAERVAQAAAGAFRERGVEVGALHAEAIAAATREERRAALVARALDEGLLQRHPEVCLDVLALHRSPGQPLPPAALARLNAFARSEVPGIRGLLPVEEAMRLLEVR